MLVTNVFDYTCEVIQNKKQLIMNDEIKKTYNSSAINYSGRHLLLFHVSNYNNTKFKGNIYYFKIQKSGKLIINLIPVRFTNELGQTEGAMFDKVTGKLFRNQGTGSFVIGPDVVEE